MNTLTYKGYAARVEFDAEDRLFHGRIAGIRDIVTFHGESVKELLASFEEAVDDYLETCEKLGQHPNKPFSGRMMLRLPPETHAAAAMAAEANGKSLNQWATEVIDKAVHR
ncbi:MAG: type II toxin-antitoxin system HicB family antitoxin [Thermodesulfobacteriota bacterium]|jgi:predicted HicB family RNase H-like nuclease